MRYNTERIDATSFPAVRVFLDLPGTGILVYRGLEEYTMRRAHAYRLPISGPEDVSALAKLMDGGAVDPASIVAVLGKTEGNGCVNDFTRGYCTQSYQSLLADRLGIAREEVKKRVVFVMSGGTEGVLAPHVTVFTREEVSGVPPRPGLAIGAAFTRDFLPEEMGTMVMVEEVARGVGEAMRDAGVDGAADVHFVQIKCPLLTSERIAQAHARGARTVTTDTYKSMGYTRAASALGVASALGEVPMAKLSDAVICQDWSL